MFKTQNVITITIFMFNATFLYHLPHSTFVSTFFGLNFFLWITFFGISPTASCPIKFGFAWNIFISPPISKNKFTAYSVLNWKLLLFHYFNLSFNYPLVSRSSFEKSLHMWLLVLIYFFKLSFILCLSPHTSRCHSSCPCPFASTFAPLPPIR